MKKVKMNIQSAFAKLCSAGLAVLGFGCSSSNEPPVMYGTPYGTFEIKGSVTTEDGKEVEGATVKVIFPDKPSSEYTFATAETDSKGNYETHGTEFPLEEYKVVCLPDDPSLAADSVMVKMNFIKDPKDDNSWDYGHAEATANFTLKNKGGGK